MKPKRIIYFQQEIVKYTLINSTAFFRRLLALHLLNLFKENIISFMSIYSLIYLAQLTQLTNYNSLKIFLI